ncbi:MAG: 50S ribosomal protein L32 [Clostridia bacterium]|nr:50S ribosomal protein L32 [Clostridia bacterium]MBQ7591658.1 50S ribosomal protein L32 [Clostridia bacterium]
MAVPKRKSSQARRDKRRSSTWKLKAPSLVKCPNCGALIKAHRVCPECGMYDGKEIVNVKDDAKKND